jgi:large subunit ribosomal protein L21
LSWEDTTIYAIIETGGKQYKVSPGDTVDIDRLEAAPEKTAVELDKVLLISNDGKITVGQPLIEGAKVLATSQGEGRTKKILVFKSKAKTRYHRTKGHREFFTKLSIDSIIAPGMETKAVKKPRRAKKEVTKDGA